MKLQEWVCYHQRAGVRIHSHDDMTQTYACVETCRAGLRAKGCEPELPTFALPRFRGIFGKLIFEVITYLAA